MFGSDPSLAILANGTVIAYWGYYPCTGPPTGFEPVRYAHCEALRAGHPADGRVESPIMLPTGKPFAVAPSAGNPRGENSFAPLQIVPSGKPFANPACAEVFLYKLRLSLKLDATSQVSVVLKSSEATPLNSELYCIFADSHEKAG